MKLIKVNTIQFAFIAAFLVAAVSSSILRKSIFAGDSCSGKCNQTGTDPSASCQCNTACTRYNDCCPDYYTLCLGQAASCAGRCDQSGFDPEAPCQCNKPCADHNDCCADYTDVCAPSDGDIPDKELEDLAEQLISMDTVNNCTTYIRVDLQGKTSSGSSSDRAPNPLLTVSPSAYARTTIEKLNALHDNYIPEKNVRETYTAQEDREIDEFIDAIFNTPIMQVAQEYLKSKNLPNGRDSFYELWFELYTRGNGVISSCGFEHVFVGELDGNEVSGFHNWERFALEEDVDLINYLGYMDYLDFGSSKGSIIEHTFNWLGENKSVSSMFIGTSPEFEMSIYTICFLARPDSKCPISLNGNKVKIQTWTIGNRGQYVATSYPDLSDNEYKRSISFV